MNNSKRLLTPSRLFIGALIVVLAALPVVDFLLKQHIISDLRSRINAVPILSSNNDEEKSSGTSAGSESLSSPNNGSELESNSRQNCFGSIKEINKENNVAGEVRVFASTTMDYGTLLGLISDPICVTGENDGFWIVDFEGKKGYVFKSSLR